MLSRVRKCKISLPEGGISVEHYGKILRSGTT
jgi:hypothetical protein